MSKFSVDYIGRTIDLLIFQGLQRTGDQPVYTSFGTAGEVVSGIQKMVQTFAVLFLTDTGSVYAQQSMGTGFIPSVSRGLLRDESDVRRAFALASTLVQRTMTAEANKAKLSADETLASVKLTKVNIDRSRGFLSLYVQLTSEAGEGTEVLLPVPLPIQ